MIRVCYVLSTSEKSGGANKSLLDLLRNLDRDRIQPYALLRRHGDIEDELLALNIPVCIVPFINSVTTGNVFKDYLKKAAYRFALPKIKRYYKSKNIELVHNNSMPVLAGMEVANDLGIPFICHIREDVENGLNVDFLDKNKHLQIANKASATIAISKFIKDAYSKYINNIEVLYDGIEIFPYYEEKELFTKEDINISIYGNLNEQKGQIVAVKAMEILQQRGYRNFKLHIVGNLHTEYGETVREYVYEKRIDNIVFVDTITDAFELKKHRYNDDINLICSSAEGLGRITIESMLAGCLTIGACAGATKEIINDGNTGLMFEEGNYHELVNVLVSVHNNRKYGRNIALQGQLFAREHFDIHKYVTNIESEYRKILKE